jgi:hypothetical protein
VTTSTEKLAQQIVALRKQLNGLSRTPQLTNSSLDNGALQISQTTVDINGNPIQQTTGYIGQQYDGTTGVGIVVGPTPPTPSAPVVDTVVGGIRVTLNPPVFLDPQAGHTSPVVAPMDFLRFDVQVSTDPAFPNTGFGPTKASIASAAGGSVTIAWPASGTTVYVRVLAVSTAGKFSNPGGTVSATTGKVNLGDLGFDISAYAGGNTIYYTVSPATPTAPAAGFTAGDLWLNQIATSTSANTTVPVGTPIYETRRWNGSAWILLQDQGIGPSLAAAIAAQTAADSKAKVFTQDTAPSYTGAANTAIWYETDAGNKRWVWSGTAWVASLLGNGSVSPNSLIASNVIATGTVTAALLETTMVLANTIVAGTLTGAHATMQSDGYHIFGLVPGEGVQEVGRLATGTNNYLGFTDSTGELVFNVDSTGYVSASGANFTGDIFVQGTSLTNSIARIPGSSSGVGASGSQDWWGYNFGAGVGSVTTETGLIEAPFYVDSSRMYLILPDLAWNLTNTAAQLNLRIRDGGTSQPTISSTVIYYRQFSAPVAGYDVSTTCPGLWQPSGSGVSQHRLLLTVQAGGTGAVNINGGVGGLEPPTIMLLDMGPAKSLTNTIVNRGGGGAGGSGTGTAAPSTQQYDTGWMAPSVVETHRGDGTVRSDTGGDIVQGWDPSGFNGDGYGFAGGFAGFPAITGTIDRIDLSLPWDWSYFNSGGTAIIAPLHSGSAASAASFVALKMASNFNVALAGKTGSQIITLPSSWYPSFKSTSSPQATIIGFGTSGGTNETFYMKFPGPNIRLRILYTQ